MVEQRPQPQTHPFGVVNQLVLRQAPKPLICCQLGRFMCDLLHVALRPCELRVVASNYFDQADVRQQTFLFQLRFDALEIHHELWTMGEWHQQVSNVINFFAAVTGGQSVIT